MTATKTELQMRMLADINNDYDKTEGSFFCDMVTSVAIEFEKSYKYQDEILNNAFVGTATSTYLDRTCEEFGIKRKKATKSTGQVEITGAVGANIAKGISVATELITFVTIESAVIPQTGKVTVSAECTQDGIVGNVVVNTIKYFPVTIEGLMTVTNPTAFVNGYDEESDKSLRERYFDKINTPATSGNAAHYEQWARAVMGVGDAKVFPIWNGPGTVKVIICNSNKRAAEQGLIENALAYIEAQRPIGATVTIESAMEKDINITATIALGNSVTLEQVKTKLEEVLTNYFKEITFSDAYVSYAKVGSILYDIDGVVDYSDLKINAGITNIVLSDVELPTVGTVVFTNVA